MALMTWTAEQYGTKVTVCDEQHKEIFRILNALHETTEKGNRLAVGNLLDELINYVVMHFQTEQKMMESKGYPDLAVHKAEHDKVTATCADLQQKFHAGTAEVNQDTTRFVRDWLDNHIPTFDLPYGPCLNG